MTARKQRGTHLQPGSLLNGKPGSVLNANQHGALQATQAGNQLIALQTQQLADLTALMAAQGRAQALEAARVASGEEQAREQLRRFLAPGAGYQAGSARMFYGNGN